jgi:xanthine dehydrogenase YagT iron-sulfur-binding subunit
MPSAVTDGTPELSAPEIRERMAGNLCRCGAYVGIVAALREAAGEPNRAAADPLGAARQIREGARA